MQSQRRIRIIDLIVFMFMGYTLAGCASGPNILSDYDRDADFGAYHTYNIMEGP